MTRICGQQVNHNPVKFLRLVSQRKLDAAAADPAYVARYEAVMAAFDAYMRSRGGDVVCAGLHGDKADRLIAYFSAEFGLHESLPIYSGGLGILSGDHCKTASDLGLPFVGVGFLYPQGYFTQEIDADCRQQALYEKLDFAEVPATPAVGSGRQADRRQRGPAGAHGLRRGVAHPGGPHPALSDGHQRGAERARRPRAFGPAVRR